MNKDLKFGNIICIFIDGWDSWLDFYVESFIIEIYFLFFFIKEVYKINMGIVFYYVFGLI